MLSFLLKFPKFRFATFVILTVIAVLLIIFFAYAALKLWRDHTETPDKPQPVGLQEAIKRSKTHNDQWVALQNTESLEWDCSTMVHWTEENSKTDWMDVIATNPDYSIVLLVTFKKPMSCDELLTTQPKFSGELTRLSRSDFKGLDYRGRLSQYPSSSTFLSLCTYCSPRKTLPIVGLSLFCLVGSVAGMAFSIKETLSARQAIQRESVVETAQGYTPSIIQNLTTAETESLLRHVFDFTPADLAANKAGRLTTRQKRMLNNPLPKFLRNIALFILLIAVMVIGIEKIGTTGPTEKHIVEGFVIGLGVLALLLDLRTRQQVNLGEVKAAYGSVTLKMDKVGDEIQDYVAMNDGLRFSLTFPQYSALIEGRPYTFYYIEGFYGVPARSKKVLSVSQ